MKHYFIWNNDLGDRQVWTDDDQVFTANFNKDEYDQYLEIGRAHV